MRTVDTVLFDKTGTLTAGEPVVVHLATAGGTSEAALLALAAAAEADSQHPLARAIVRAAEERATTSPRHGLPVAHGRRRRGDRPDPGRRPPRRGRRSRPPARARPRPLPDAAAWAGDGSTVLHVVVAGDDGTGTASDSRSGEVVGAFALADAIRPSRARPSTRCTGAASGSS